MKKGLTNFAMWMIHILNPYKSRVLAAKLLELSSSFDPDPIVKVIRESDISVDKLDVS